MRCRSLAMALAIELALRGTSLAADPRFPDWPCNQIKVPEISVAAVWAGPSIDDVGNAWEEDATIRDLVARLAARRTPLDDAQKSIADTITGTESERQKKAKLIFVGLFKTLNHERSEVMQGIERYARKQKEFSDQIRSAILQLREPQDRPNPDRQNRRADRSRRMGHAYLRGAPQDDEFRLRSARYHRATSVRARPCNPTIARVRAAAGTQDLSGNRVLRDGSIVVIEERHAEAQQQLVDGGLILSDGAIELAFPILIGVPHAHGNAIGEAGTGRLLDQWHDGCRRGRLSAVIAGHWAPEDSRIDFAGREIMHHRCGRGIDAGVDDQRIGLGIGHETVGRHVVSRRRSGHDADTLALEARIAQRVHALQAVSLLEHERVGRAVVRIGDLHQIVALRRTHDDVAFVRRERIAHEARCLRVPTV